MKGLKREQTEKGINTNVRQGKRKSVRKRVEKCKRMKEKVIHRRMRKGPRIDEEKDKERGEGERETETEMESMTVTER